MARKIIEYSQRLQPPEFYAKARKTGIYGGIRWINDIRINSDDEPELHEMLAHARDKIEKLDARLDVLSVNVRTRLGIYMPINPLVTGAQGARRWIAEQLRTLNPLDPYFLPERGNSHIINNPEELDAFLIAQKIAIGRSTKKL